jgi:hypothetical protein
VSVGTDSSVTTSSTASSCGAVSSTISPGLSALIEIEKIPNANKVYKFLIFIKSPHI